MKGTRTLPSISAQQLDDYLANGWFRMDQTVFTTQYLQEENFTFHEVFWLRQHLPEFQFPKWFAKMKHKFPYRIEITTAPPTATHEWLYQTYRESKPKDWPPSLESILYEDRTETIFNTYTINIYDDAKLIAAGFYDMGEKSAAGIVNFYEPAYAKHSLGKYLYLLAIELAIDTNKTYFYPGYFAPGNPHFDYKLNFHKPSVQFYNAQLKSWSPYRFFGDRHLTLLHIEKKLIDLTPKIEGEGIPYRFIHNANFGVIHNSLLDSPYALYILPTETNPWQYAITFDTNTNHYYIFDCSDLDCDEFIQEENGLYVCFQFLNLKSPAFKVYNAEDVVPRVLFLNDYLNENSE